MRGPHQIDAREMIARKHIRDFPWSQVMRGDGTMNEWPTGEIISARTKLAASMEAMRSRIGGRDLTGEENGAWDYGEGLLEFWDKHIAARGGRGGAPGELVRLATRETAEAEGRYLDEPAAPIFEDNRGNLVKALGRKESFSSWARERGLIDTGEPRISMADFVKKICATSPAMQQSIGDSSLGGYLVPPELSMRVLDIARNAMQVVRAGAQVLPMASESLRLVKIVAPAASATWRAEHAPIADTEVNFAPIDLTAKTVAMMLCTSVELAEDAQAGGGLATLIENQIGQGLALAIDLAALHGNGVGQQPKGLFLHDGCNFVDMEGADIEDYSPLSRAIEAVRGRNVEPGPFIMNSQCAGGLERLVDALKQPLRPPTSVAERQFLVSNQIPFNLPTSWSGSPETGSGSTGSAIFTGLWSSLLLGMRAQVRIEASRVAGDAFRNLQILIRGYARCDIAVMREWDFGIVRGFTKPSVGSPA